MSLISKNKISVFSIVFAILTTNLSCSLMMSKDKDQEGSLSKEWLINHRSVSAEVAEEIVQLSKNQKSNSKTGVWVKGARIKDKVEIKSQALNTTHRTINSEGEGAKSDPHQVESYVVKKGDTLMKIAFEHYGNLYRWREIYETNKEKLIGFNQLIPGTSLVIKGVEYVVIEKNGHPYLIEKGDTLLNISRGLYGSHQFWGEIWKNNPQLIQDPNKIYAGFKLFYPPLSEVERNKNRRLATEAK